MLETVLKIITVCALVIIAICQVKQAFFPEIITAFDDEKTGIEIPKDTETNEGSPVYNWIMESYARAKTAQQPSEFIQKIIEESGDTGVEIITDKEEKEGC